MKTQTIETEPRFSRRKFCQAAGLGVGAALLSGPQLLAQQTPPRRLKIGHTGITWGYRPQYAPQAIEDLGSLGFLGFESFGSYFGPLQAQGGMKSLLEKAHLPLVSAYCTVNLTDYANQKTEVDKIVGWGKSIKDCGGTVAVIGPNNVPRDVYNISGHKAEIVDTLNEMGKRLADIGIIAALHPHTGTCIENRDEVYTVLDAVDTDYVKFGPDTGQLAKAHADPVKIVSDYIELVEHVHLKDWDGGEHWEEYCPLGEGRVDNLALLDLLEKSPIDHMIMIELDWDGPDPKMAPIETARIAKAYVEQHGYTF